MSSRFYGLVILGLIAISLLFSSIYILDQRQIALVVQFGEPIDQESSPGLKFKVPFIQNVLFFDKRIQNLSSDTSEVIAADQKTMRVDAFAKYRIVDGLKFYQAVQNEEKFKSRFASILDSSMRQILGSVPFHELLSPKRVELMKKVRTLINNEAKGFGVEVVDFRIMRADLPDKSKEAVYRRMSTDREKEAKVIRAQGSEEAQVVRANADRERMFLLADAKKKSEILRGQGDAESIKISASAFNRDPQFYEFYRALEAYKSTINKDDTKIILTPDNDFMRYFYKPAN